MSAIDNAKAHFKTRLSAGLQGPIKVEEWGIDIWYKPLMSMSQQSQIFELYQSGKASEAAVQLLIIRALDADGTPHFNKLDKTELMKSVDSEVIGAIVEQISANDAEGEDGLGN